MTLCEGTMNESSINRVFREKDGILLFYDHQEQIMMESELHDGDVIL